MAKSNLAKFRKTAEVVDHILSIQSVSFVDSVFGETFYLKAYDNTAEELIIVTGGSGALKAQLHGVEDIEGLVAIIRARGKSYELVENEV